MSISSRSGLQFTNLSIIREVHGYPLISSWKRWTVLRNFIDVNLFDGAFLLARDRLLDILFVDVSKWRSISGYLESSSEITKARNWLGLPEFIAAHFFLLLAADNLPNVVS
jgi:hypothetical protein